MKHTAETLLSMKKSGEPIAMATAYDLLSASLAEAAGVETILVGDSAANVVFGLDSTVRIGMDEMLLCAKTVCRCAPETYVAADFPFGADATPETALANAERFLAAGASSVKIELPDERAWKALEALRARGIPAIAHLGLLPQTARSRRQCARTDEEAKALLLAGARADSLGVDAIVAEHVPDAVGEALARSVAAPVIGIGAGSGTDGQVLVFHDLLGLFEKSPPFAPRFVEGRALLAEGMRRYVEWVKTRGASLRA